MAWLVILQICLVYVKSMSTFPKISVVRWLELYLREPFGSYDVLRRVGLTSHITLLSITDYLRFLNLPLHRRFDVSVLISNK
jgi:hypothetical protein